MNKGIKTIIYPVSDINTAKAFYANLTGSTPSVDQPYYVQFNIGDLDIGLDPNAAKKGITMPVVFYQVDDIQVALQSLLDAGAQPNEPVKDVGYGKLIATVKDTSGTIVGLLQMPA